MLILRTKLCSKCLDRKPLSDYPPSSWHCKECRRRVGREYYAENKEKYRKRYNYTPVPKKPILTQEELNEKRREYYSLPETKARVTKYYQSEGFKKYHKEYRQRPEVKVRNRKRDKTVENREKRRIYSRKRRSRPEVIERERINNRLWRERNPGKVREARLRYQGKLKDGSVTNEELLKLINDSGNICFWCDNEIPKGEIHIDHIYPLSKNGEHNIYNLAVTCSTCNQAKGAKDPEDFLEISIESLQNEEFSEDVS